MKQQKLRVCQKNALYACSQNDKGIISMFCGAGKTLVEVMLCINEKVSCLIVPRNALLNQHLKLFRKLCHIKEDSFENKKYKLIVINCENDFKNFTKTKKKVVFIVNNSSIQKLPVTPDLIVVDEAHTHMSVIKTTLTVKHCKKRFFFTATPTGMDDTKFYGNIIYSY